MTPVYLAETAFKVGKFYKKTINLFLGYVWPSSARETSTFNRSSISSASSGPPIASFDAEMRSVLEQQSTDEIDNENNLDKTDPVNDTHQALEIENELSQSELIIDNVCFF